MQSLQYSDKAIGSSFKNFKINYYKSNNRGIAYSLIDGLTYGNTNTHLATAYRSLFSYPYMAW